MKLKKLTIIGFKSFADKVTLDFDCEIVGIVGPNGCGKSNIVDAVRWVMGEQSAKSLRGDKMFDILFAGSSTRKPQNYAEVSVTLTDIGDELPIAYDELTITRRLHRNGDSEYLINREPARLRDIQGLFLGSGIGKNAFSIFEQGKLDQVINLNPVERRAIFDEAAGTSRFLQRKKETMRKLATISENYNRVHDVHAEVEKQAKQLKKQANQAKNYQENKTRLEELERNVLLFRYRTFSEKNRELEVQIGSLDSEIENSFAAMRSLEEGLDNVKKALQEEEVLTKEKQKQLTQAETAVHVQEAEMRQKKHRLFELKKREEVVKKELQELAADRKYLCEETTQKEKSLLILSEKKDELSEEVAKKKESYTEVETALNRLREGLKEAKESHLTLFHEEGRLRTALQEKKLKFETRFLSICEKEKEKESAIETLEKQIVGQERKVKTLAVESDALKQECEQIEKTVQNISKQISDIASRKKRVAQTDLEGFSKEESVLLKEGKNTKSPLYKKVEPLVVKTLLVKNEAALDLLLDYTMKKRITDFSVIVQESRGENLTTFEKKRNQTVEAFRKKEMDLVQANFALQRSLSDLEEIQKSLVLLKEEKQKLQGEKKTFAKLEKELQNKQRAASSFQANLKKQENIVEKQEKKWSEAAQEWQKWQSEFQQIFAEWRGAEQELKFCLAKEQQKIAQEKRLHQELSEHKSTVENTLQEISRQEKEIEANTLALQTLQKSASEWDKKNHEKKKERDQIEKELTECRKETTELEKQRHKIDILLAEDAAQRKTIEQELVEKHSLAPDTLESIEFSLENGMEEAEKEIRLLRSSLDNSGAVNMMAIEEFQEKQERFEYLDKQLKDLEEAKQDLEKIITKLDSECRKIFKTTFKQIRENFQKNFQILFNGGEADLTFTESTDILEAGIEIVAKPPGKQMRAISLLSGGEKCLTALALLFSIFEVKPAPFCILDEVDAPLDDSNIVRFTNVLKQFIDRTQFIIVTHNKKTMAIADVLFGVSMEEKGVSKLISLVFEKRGASALV